VPKDWKIIETSPGGVEKSFAHRKTHQWTWYIPEGATAAEILKVPGARKYWSSVEDVEEYMMKMAAEKEKYGDHDSQ